MESGKVGVTKRTFFFVCSSMVDAIKSASLVRLIGKVNLIPPFEILRIGVGFGVTFIIGGNFSGVFLKIVGVKIVVSFGLTELAFSDLKKESLEE